jgi:ABC-type nitrate/sulfonate/bicarbonate transport system substrate-binding protein
LRIGTAVLGDYGMVAPIAVALEKGFFAKHGLDVEERGGDDEIDEK